MAVIPELSPDEPIRLAALRDLNILDTPLEDRFERITRIAKRLLDVKIAAISLVDVERQWFKSIQGCDNCETSRGISFCGHAILQEDIFVVEDAREDHRFHDNPLVIDEPYVVFYAGCPVRAEDGSRIGMMCVNDDKPRVLTEEEAETLRDLAGFVETELRSVCAAAVQESLVKKISAEKRQGMIDELTRLWNRRGFNEMAPHVHEDAVNGKDPYSMVFVDLDEFKPINDSLGHAAGDEVLRATARRMLSAIRDTDIVARLGGDEFVLLLSPCAGQEAAVKITEKIRQRLIESPVKTTAGPAAIKASFGICFVEAGTDMDLESVMKQADLALYEAKDAGRNQVSCASGRRAA